MMGSSCDNPDDSAQRISLNNLLSADIPNFLSVSSVYNQYMSTTGRRPMTRRLSRTVGRMVETLWRSKHKSHFLVSLLVVSLLVLLTSGRYIALAEVETE